MGRRGDFGSGITQKPRANTDVWVNGDGDLVDQSGTLVGGLRDFRDLKKAAADLAAADTVKTLRCVPGNTITLEEPLVINHGTMDIDFSHTIIQGGNITGTAKAITLFYDFSDYNGWRRYGFTPALRNLRLIGPGPNLAADYLNGVCTAGVYTQGVVQVSPLPNKAVRPKLVNPFIHGFDVGYEMGDVSFLGGITGGVIDMCGVGVAQRAATDSGEMVTLTDTVIQRTMLPYLLLDGSSEIVHKGGSIDYSPQVCVIATGSSWGALTLDNVHWETRGAFDGSDTIGYPVTGSGTDPRALISGRDAAFDIDGVGSRVIVIAGLGDLNTNGLNPLLVLPWSAIKCLVKTRTKSSGFIAVEWSPQTLANSDQLFHSGFGTVKTSISRMMFPSANTLPARRSNNPDHNRLFHGSFPSAQLADLWTIRRDAAEITDRFTGTNGSLARDSAVTRAITIAPALTLSGTGTGVQTVTSTGDAFTPDMLGRNFVVGSGVASITSVDNFRQMTLNVSVAFASSAIAAGAAVARNTAGLRVTKAAGKVAGDNFEAACFVPVNPDEVITVHGWYWVPASGAVTGTPAINYRFTRLHMPRVVALAGTGAAAWSQTIPTQGAPDTAGTDWDLGFARSSAVIRTVDLSLATTGQWVEFILTVPNDSGAGQMQVPQWATHLELGINLNACGAGNIYFTDLTVSPW